MLIISLCRACMHGRAGICLLAHVQRSLCLLLLLLQCGQCCNSPTCIQHALQMISLRTACLLGLSLHSLWLLL
jgi:hypothetical protein